MQKIGRLFGYDHPRNVIFTPGVVYAQNMVVKGVLNLAPLTYIPDTILIKSSASTTSRIGFTIFAPFVMTRPDPT